MSESICRLSTINSSSFDSILWINLPFEEAFSMLMVIKSRYRRRLTDEQLKHCLHLCLSNFEPSSIKLSQNMHYHASYIYYIQYFLHLVLFSLCAFLLTVFVLCVLLSSCVFICSTLCVFVAPYVCTAVLCVYCCSVCVFVVLSVYCCSYFRCRTAG